MVRLKIYVYRDMDPEITQGTEESKKEEFASCSYISYFWCNILELILFCLLNFSSLGLFSVFCKFLFLHTRYIPTCFTPPLALPRDLAHP